jgi:SAM-dependent methyltransferase
MMAPASFPVSSLFSERKILNLGSGKKRFPDAVNLDLVPDTQPDIVWDLNQLPWPLPDNHFERVHAFDVIEHLENTLAVMREIHRVCAPGAIIEITVPHFSSANAFTDPTHRHYFGLFSFDYFTGENQWGFYTSVRFKRRSIQLFFHPTLLNKLVRRLADRFPAAYERRWAWIFPAWFLSFQLEVVK